MSTVVPPAFAWGKGGEIFGNLVRERTTGRINIKQYPGASLVQGQQDREFSAMRQGIIDVLCGAPINWSGTVPRAGRLHAALHPARPQGLRRGDHQPGDRQRLLRPRAQGRRRAAGRGRDRLPADQQLQAPADQARRPEGHQGARRRQPDVRRDHDRHGRQPDLHELGRRAAGAGLGRGRRAGEPARGLPGGEDPHARPEVRDQVELLQRHPAVRDRQPGLASWTPADQKIVREAAQDAAKQQIALVRKLYRRGRGARARARRRRARADAGRDRAWQIACRRVYARWKVADQRGAGRARSSRWSSKSRKG